MIEDIRGNVDYEASGTGPTLVLVPGSCSTGVRMIAPTPGLAAAHAL